MSDLTHHQTSIADDGSPLAGWLIERIRFYDQVDPEEVALDAPLTELGLDSIYVLTLCGDIEDTYGIAVDPMFMADNGTVRDLASALSARIGSA